MYSINKNVMLSFIDKFILNNSIPSLCIEVKDNVTITNFISPNKTLVGYVSSNAFELPDSVWNIFETDKFKKFISAMEDDITLKFENKNNDLKNLILKDSYKEVTFTFVDDEVIKFFKAPNKKTFTYELTQTLPDWFTDEFVKSKTALSESSNVFAIEVKNGLLSFILNYNINNVNKIKIDIEIDDKDLEIKPVIFDSEDFKNVLLANKSLETSISLFSKGLILIKSSNSIFDNEYYIVNKKI